jgi:O-antigen/teichoic acid export membrane protein
MFLASSIGSFFNLLYQLIMLRLVSKETFASLNSLLSLLVIISVPASALNTAVTKHVSTHYARKNREELNTVWQTLALHTFLPSTLILILSIAFSRNIASFLQISSTDSIIILAGIFFLSAISSVVNGGLQGLEKFKWLAAITVAAGILKLFSSVLLVKKFPSSLEGALFGLLLPIFIGIALSIWPLRSLLQERSREKLDLKQLYFYILPVLLAGLCFALFTNIDMVLVKRFFSEGAQDYAVAQMIGKIILSIPGVIYVVMFSRASHLHAKKEDPRNILKRSLFFTFVLSFLVAVFYNIFPGFAFRLLGVEVSPQTIMVGRFFSISMLFYALSNVLFFYQLSIERYTFIKPLLMMAAGLVAAINLFHKTTVMVAVTVLIFSLAVLLLNINSTFRKTHPLKE